MALREAIPRMTAAEFDAWAQRPERGDTIYEFIDGEVWEVPSNPYVSKIAGWILTAINLFLRTNDIGHVTGADGGYWVAGALYAPDVAFITYARQPELAKKGFNPSPPDLAVEVVSDETNAQEQNQLRLKIAGYLAAGVIVWVVRPEARLVEVYRPGQKGETVGEDGVLSGETVLPGFELPVKDIFPAPKTDEETE